MIISTKEKFRIAYYMKFGAFLIAFLCFNLYSLKSSILATVSHLSGNSTTINRKASYSPAIYAWVAYSISSLSRHSSRRLQTSRCLSVVSPSNPTGDSAFPQSPYSRFFFWWHFGCLEFSDFGKL